MNDVFKDLLNISITVYLNNILIYSDDLATHCKHICEVLKQLCTNGLFTRADKCEFHSDSVEYLATSSPLTAFVCLRTKSKSSRSGLNLRRSRTSSPS
jgi:hypothetical protein